MVVGTDGVHSVVAKEAAAPEYDARPPLATFYYSYYSGFDAEDVEQYVRDHHGAACFPTHEGLTLIVAVWPSGKFHEVRSDIEGHVKKVHESAPGVADRLQRARREERWVGTAGIPNYFRRPYGPGWALAGDAGYAKDPITAQGISDAFQEADDLAAALHDAWSNGREPEERLAECQSRRDRRSKPMYDFTCQLARLEPPPPTMARLFAALRDDREETGRFYSALTGSTPIEDYLGPQNLARVLGPG